MNQTKVSQLVKDQKFEGFLIVKTAEKRVNKNGDPYLDITFADDSQDINAKVWNSDETPPRPGAVLKIRATVTEYNNRLQMKIERMRETEEGDAVDLSELVSAAPRPSGEMFQEIMDVISGMQNPVLKAITGELIKKAEEKIQYYPAAQSMHHAERSGLLHHLTDMLTAAKAICACYPYLDQDLLLSGVIVHDLGKLDEMISSPLGSVTEYSKQGLLLGHIVTGVADVRDTARTLGYMEDDEYPLLLAHMILSHHGIPEYGSPKPPMFPEAEVLNWLDVLDSRLNEMQSAISRTKPGAFSDRVFALDRRVYHPVYQNDSYPGEDGQAVPFEPGNGDDETPPVRIKPDDAERAYNRFL